LTEGQRKRDRDRDTDRDRDRVGQTELESPSGVRGALVSKKLNVFLVNFPLKVTTTAFFFFFLTLPAGNIFLGN
jgi:hypothetical protein